MAEPYIINNVEALWPKLDRTYAFDQKANQSMPCDPMAPNAEYSIELKMGNETAKGLYIAMVNSYKANKKDGWPAAPSNPMVKHDDGMRTVKCSLKGQYSGEKTRKPLQVDAMSNPLPDDFQLTTGSTINIAVTFYPYKYMQDAPSVALRIRQIQVIKLEERKVRSLFGKVEDGYIHNSESVFQNNVVDMPQKKESDVDLTGFEDGNSTTAEPEPVKVLAKKAVASGSNGDSVDLDDILAAWDDD
jgi:hypothetical protein